jgi:hypothetical protein
MTKSLSALQDVSSSRIWLQHRYLRAFDSARKWSNHSFSQTRFSKTIFACIFHNSNVHQNLTVKPQPTYSSIYVLLIYVLYFFNVLLYIRTQIWFTYFVLHTWIRFTYFVLHTWIQYTCFQYVKQSTYIELEYVKWSTYIKFACVKRSTYIKFEYVLRVILSLQFCKFFDLYLFWVRQADEWHSTCSNSIERKGTDDFNFNLQ